MAGIALLLKRAFAFIVRPLRAQTSRSIKFPLSLKTDFQQWNSSHRANIKLDMVEKIRTIVPMKIIADANTFIAVALNEPEKEKIIRLTEGHDLISPDVLPFEIGNALTAMMKRNVLKKDEVISAWEMIQQIPVDLRHTNIKSALRIAIEFRIYAYDAYFLECADNLRSPLLTLDIGMQRVAREMGIKILE